MKRGEVVIISTPEGRATGLRLPSLVQCENLVTIDQSFVLRTIGRLPDSLMKRIDGCLKAALGIKS